MKNWILKAFYPQIVSQLKDHERQIGFRDAHVKLTEDENKKLRTGRGHLKPARFELEGGPTDEELSRTLAGTDSSPIVKAIVAKVGMSLVEASDLATETPREQIVVDGQVIQGFTSEMRTHAAGGAAALAVLLGDLQELTAHKEEPKAKAEKKD